MYDDDELAAKFRWNRNRQSGPTKPGRVHHDKELLCQQEIETFAYKTCMGQALPEFKVKDLFHMDFFSDEFQQELLEWLVGDWLKKDS